MPGKYEWLIIVPDFPGSLEKRIEVREEHLKNITPMVKDGRATFGGATLEEQPADGLTGPPKMKGSAMVIMADTEKEAKDLLEGDIYARSGVWDVANAQIFPFRTAIRTPKE